MLTVLIPHTIAYHLSPKCAPIRTFILYHLPKPSSSAGIPQACLPSETGAFATIKRALRIPSRRADKTLVFASCNERMCPFVAGNRLPSIGNPARHAGLGKNSGEHCEIPHPLPYPSSSTQEYYMHHRAPTLYVPAKVVWRSPASRADGDTLYSVCDAVPGGSEPIPARSCQTTFHQCVVST